MSPTPGRPPPGPRPRPVEIRLKKADKTLEVDFDSGERFIYPAELLRVESPSAEVQGHGAKQIVGGCRHVGLVQIEAVGHYAVRLIFDDSHDTGIYSWEYLYELGVGQEAIWRRYLEALASRGLSRDAAPSPGGVPPSGAGPR